MPVFVSTGTCQDLCPDLKKTFGTGNHKEMRMNLEICMGRQTPDLCAQEKLLSCRQDVLKQLFAQNIQRLTRFIPTINFVLMSPLKNMHFTDFVDPVDLRNFVKPNSLRLLHLNISSINNKIY